MTDIHHVDAVSLVLADVVLTPDDTFLEQAEKIIAALDAAGFTIERKKPPVCETCGQSMWFEP
jgi:hypothetical protein